MPDDFPQLPALDTAEEVRRSIFASHVAYGSTLPDALLRAGYQDPSLHLGWTLMASPDVRAQVARHREHIRDKVARSVSDLVEQLDRDREFAIDSHNAAVALAATMAQAKLLGHIDPSLSMKTGKGRLVVSWGDDDDDSGATVIEGRE